MSRSDLQLNPLQSKRITDNSDRASILIARLQRDFIRKYEMALKSSAHNNFLQDSKLILTDLQDLCADVVDDLYLTDHTLLSSRVSKIFSFMKYLTNFSLNKVSECLLQNSSVKKQLALAIQKKQICENCSQNLQTMKLKHLEQVHFKSVYTRKDRFQQKRKQLQKLRNEHAMHERMKMDFEQLMDSDEMNKFMTSKFEQYIQTINGLLHNRGIVQSRKSSQIQHCLKELVQLFSDKSQKSFVFDQAQENQIIKKISTAANTVQKINNQIIQNVKPVFSTQFYRFCLKLGNELANSKRIRQKQLMVSKQMQTQDPKSKQSVKTLQNKIQKLTKENEQKKIKLVQFEKLKHTNMEIFKQLQKQVSSGKSKISQLNSSLKLKQAQIVRLKVSSQKERALLQNQISYNNIQFQNQLKKAKQQFQQTLLRMKSSNQESLDFLSRFTQTKHDLTNVCMQTDNLFMDLMKYQQNKIKKYQKILKDLGKSNQVKKEQQIQNQLRQRSIKNIPLVQVQHKQQAVSIGLITQQKQAQNQSYQQKNKARPDQKSKQQQTSTEIKVKGKSVKVLKKESKLKKGSRLIKKVKVVAAQNKSVREWIKNEQSVVEGSHAQLQEQQNTEFQQFPQSQSNIRQNQRISSKTNREEKSQKTNQKIPKLKDDEHSRQFRLAKTNLRRFSSNQSIDSDSFHKKKARQSTHNLDHLPKQSKWPQQAKRTQKRVLQIKKEAKKIQEKPFKKQTQRGQINRPNIKLEDINYKNINVQQTAKTLQEIGSKLQSHLGVAQSKFGQGQPLSFQQQQQNQEIIIHNQFSLLFNELMKFKTTIYNFKLRSEIIDFVRNKHIDSRNLPLQNHFQRQAATTFTQSFHNKSFKQGPKVKSSSLKERRWKSELKQINQQNLNDQRLQRETNNFINRVLNPIKRELKKKKQNSIHKVEGNFSHQDLALFGGPEKAHLFQNLFLKNSIRSLERKFIKQLDQQQLFINQLYEHLEVMRNVNQQFYRRIYNFINYPYLTAFNKVQTLSISQVLSRQKFRVAMKYVLNEHKKCSECKHIINFLSKIGFIMTF